MSEVTITRISRMNRVATVAYDHTTRIWDADTGGILASVNTSITGEASFSRMSCSRDGHRLATSSGSIISVWDISSFDGTLELKQTINAGHERIQSLCLNSDGSRSVSRHVDGNLCYWDIASGELLWSRNVADSEQVNFGLDISSDGAVIAVGLNCGFHVGLMSAVTGEEICQFQGHTRTVISIKFSHDASRIASSSRDKTIRIWDVAMRSLVMLLQGHTQVVTSLSYSCEGSRLASGSSDKSVMVWDLVSGECLYVLKGHSGSVSCVSFSDDNRRIASGGCDNRVILWDCASGCEVVRLEGHTNVVSGVHFLPVSHDYLLK